MSHPFDDAFVERRAMELLQQVGYLLTSSEAVEAERTGAKHAILGHRLALCLKKLNPWISDDDLHDAVRAVSSVEAPSLLEANEKVHTILTYGMATSRDRDLERRSRSVRFFDFENPLNNDLLVVRQFPIKISQGSVILDIVLFINGIPLVVVECKTITSGEKWGSTVVDQMLRYQALNGDVEDLGVRRLFETVQIVVVTSGTASLYGAVGAPAHSYSEWKDPYPLTVSQLEHRLGRRPDAQDLLVYGLLSPANLLDVIQNFILFNPDFTLGRAIRRICRSHQYSAVNRALDRVRGRKASAERGGILWHTQGSGKTLTMLWLALKLRSEATLENPKIVFVADRLDVVDQIAQAFARYGFPAFQRAESVSHLRALLSAPGGGLVFTNIQKFQDTREVSISHLGTSKASSILSDAANICVIISEAHRTQHGQFAASMRKALPNAIFFGFTGTPLERSGQSTLQVFGNYIDMYTLKDALADGAVLPVYYESRLPRIQVEGSLSETFIEDGPADGGGDLGTRSTIRKAIASAPWRIESIARDIAEHYRSVVKPNGFKAQIVAASREAAIAYKEALDKLGGLQCAIIISGNTTTDNRRRLTAAERSTIVQRFQNPRDPLSILIVCNMLLTGLDAPIEQAMYIDSPLKGPLLLQAIARVNRPTEGKTHGLIVDYWGIADALKDALAMYLQDGENTIRQISDELPRLRARRAALMRLFRDVKNRDSLDEFVAVVESKDIRADFDFAFRQFVQSLDIMLPDPQAQAYVDDLRWLEQVRKAVSERSRRDEADASPTGEILAKRTQGQSQGIPSTGPDPMERGLRDILASTRIVEAGRDEGDEDLVLCIKASIQSHTKIVDWANKNDIQRQMRSAVKRHLASAGVTMQVADQLARRVVEFVRLLEGQ